MYLDQIRYSDHRNTKILRFCVDKTRVYQARFVIIKYVTLQRS